MSSEIKRSNRVELARNEGDLHACSQTSMVRSGIEPSSVSGQSAPIVFVTLRPVGVYTSHAHPDPKAVAPL